MGSHIAETVRLLVSELVRWRRSVTILFLVIAISLTLLGLIWPKSYVSSTTVHVSDNDVIDGLLEGGGGEEEGADWVAVAEELLLGRRVLLDVLEAGGRTGENVAPERLERLMDGLRKRTSVTHVSDTIIRIRYRDKDPKRAQKVTKEYGRLLIREISEANSSNTEEALSFIEKQALKYEEKLDSLETAVEKFREENPEAGPEAEERAADRVASLSEEYQELSRTLKEQQAKKQSLEEQVSPDAVSSEVVASVEDDYRQELNELRNRLANLRLRYRDTYPDVKATKRKVERLEKRLTALRNREQATDREEAARKAITASPVLAELRNEAHETATRIKTLKSQLRESERQLKTAKEYRDKVRNNSRRLSQLTRDYEVTKELYQDLLRRREAARVKASLDGSGEGAGLKTEEPAFLPHRADGPRLLYFMSAGILFGAVIPVGLLFALQHVDPRIRRPEQLPYGGELPVLVRIPRYLLPLEERSKRRGIIASAAAVLLGVVIVAVMGILRLKGLI